MKHLMVSKETKLSCSHIGQLWLLVLQGVLLYVVTSNCVSMLFVCHKDYLYMNRLNLSTVIILKFQTFTKYDWMKNATSLADSVNLNEKCHFSGWACSLTFKDPWVIAELSFFIPFLWIKYKLQVTTLNNASIYF